MKAIYMLFFLLAFVSISCSDDDSNDPAANPATGYFNFTVNGTTVALDTIGDASEIHTGNIARDGDEFLISIYSGFSSNGSSETMHRWQIRFDMEGHVISAIWRGGNNGTIRYRSFIHFPANYFSVNILSHSEADQHIKLEFSGDLYMDHDDMSSEMAQISGELDLDYGINESAIPPFTVYQIEQYCNADFNGSAWKARFEHELSEFTSYDPYRIEIHFDENAVPGSFALDAASTENYLRFSKFNAQTLQYDYYDVSGVLAHSYREFHGADYYSFIGTFNFTAVNPLNPNDIITVTNGTFRSMQQF